MLPPAYGCQPKGNARSQLPGHVLRTPIGTRRVRHAAVSAFQSRLDWFCTARPVGLKLNGTSSQLRQLLSIHLPGDAADGSSPHHPRRYLHQQNVPPPGLVTDAPRSPDGGLSLHCSERPAPPPPLQTMPRFVMLAQRVW
jgi:hypothetical protein